MSNEFLLGDFSADENNARFPEIEVELMQKNLV